MAEEDAQPGEEALAPALRQLAEELDHLSGRSVRNVAVDGLPDLSGTDFRLTAQIGSGGFGTVYQAVQRSLDRVVAVKVLAASFFRIPTLKSQFEHEARIVARLHHPNIIPVFAAGTTERHCFFAMEYIDGVSAEQTTFPSLEALMRFGLCVAEALAYAHQCGVVHRDVKPSNILLATNGTAKIGDFGLSCLIGAQSPGQHSGGTRKYMAPEQRLHGQSTTLGDQYSLGVTLLELAAKQPNLPTNPDFSAILAKATAEEPSRRYPNMEALASDLRRCLASEPVAARPAGWIRRFCLWRRRNPVAAFGGLAAVCCVAALLVALAEAHRRTQCALVCAVDALHRVEAEATGAAQALAEALTESDPEDVDRRDAGFKRAIASVQALAERFPDSAAIREALTTLEKAREEYLRQRAQRRPRRPLRSLSGAETPPPGQGPAAAPKREAPPFGQRKGKARRD